MDSPDASGNVVYAREGLSSSVGYSSSLHLAIGMFDGVHAGHLAVLRQAIEAARMPGEFSGVFTFDPHPSRVLRPAKATRLIMPLERRIRLIHDAGIDFVIVRKFDEAYGSIGAEYFVPSLMKVFPLLKSLHVGENFRFGAGRSGNVDTLRSSVESEGLVLEVVKREHLGGDPVSSSRIRKGLRDGCMKEVNAMLGRPYVAEGIVVPGKGIGRKLSFPTLNLCWNPETRPKFGVYGVLLKAGPDGRALPGIANYGLRPTVDDSTDPLLEVHLLENGSIPDRGDSVRVAFLDFVREERSFASVEALREQIAVDVEVVLASFSREKSLPTEF